jgi:hypothetical protein
MDISKSGKIKGIFNFSLIPCGFQKREGETESWRVFVIAAPEITGEDESYDISETVDNVNELKTLFKNHPILKDGSDYSFFVHNAGGRHPVKSTLVVQDNTKDISSLLVDILKREGTFYTTLGQGKESSAIEEVTSSDEPKIKNFIDIPKLFEQSTSVMKQACSMFVSNFEEMIDHKYITKTNSVANSNPASLSWATSRKLIADYLSQETSKNLKVKSEELEQYKQLLKTSGKKDFEDASNLICNNEPTPGAGELLMAILDNFELCKSFGLVHEFLLEVSSKYIGIEDFEGALEISFNGSSKTRAKRDKYATAVSRINIKSKTDSYFVVQPLSKDKRKKLNLLTQLKGIDNPKNIDGNDVKDNYQAADVNVDSSIIKNSILTQDHIGFLQNKKKASGSANESKYLAENSLVGVTPLNGEGVTIFGPARDLTTDAYIDERANLYSSLTGLKLPNETLPDGNEEKGEKFFQYLEDLWFGYRLDIAKSTGKKTSKSNFISIHHHQILPKKGSSHVPHIKDTEGYINKEQATLDIKNEPKIHPALFTWLGKDTVQSVPWEKQSLDKSSYNTEYWEVAAVELRQSHNLIYGDHISYRLRAAFQSGIGLLESEADELIRILTDKTYTSEIPQNKENFAQELTYTRKRTYTPGVLLNLPEGEKKDKNTKGGSTEITLSKKGEFVDIWLYPQPLDREEVRYSGLLKKAWIKNKRKLNIVEGQLVKFFTDKKIPIEGGDIQYFVDPDIRNLRIRAWALGNKWLSKNQNEKPNSYRVNANKGLMDCTEVQPFLVEVTGKKGDVVSYGEGDPFSLKPILLRLKATSNERPKARVRKLNNKYDFYQLSVPPGEVIKLEITPVIDNKNLAKSSFNKYMLNQTSVSTLNSQDSSSRLSQLPGLTTAIELNIKHTVSKPIFTPMFSRQAARAIQGGDTKLVRIERESNQKQVKIIAKLDVDSRTTSSIKLRAEWDNYIDNPSQPKPLKAGRTGVETDTRSIFFGPANRLHDETSILSRNTNQLILEESYCVEDTIHLDHSEGGTSVKNELELDDLKHHMADITIVGQSRYKELYEKQVTSVTSQAIKVSIPSAMVPPSLVFSHMIPMTKQIERPVSKGSVFQSEEKLRMFFHRPFNITGLGETIAFLFDKKWRKENHIEQKRISSDVTAGGEDPFYRTYEKETKNNITPQVLTDMLKPYTDSTTFEDDYPVIYHSELSGDMSNLMINEGGELPDTTDIRNANVVCVRPTYDENERLWYIDLYPNGRTRWFKFICLRSQRNSLPSFQFSKEPIIINFFSDSGHQVTVSEYAGLTRIIVDTAHFKSKNFSDDPNASNAKQRFRLDILNKEKEYIYKFSDQNKSIVPKINTTTTNARYEWELRLDKNHIVGIWDDFKGKYIKTVNLRNI